MIRRVVLAFYAGIRRDPVLGPIFNGAIGDGWDAHLDKLCDFWSSVLLMTGRFKGRPMQAHAALPHIERPHFARWLEMFSATVRRECPPDAAAVFEQKSRMIAESLMLGLDVSRGVLPPGAPRA